MTFSNKLYSALLAFALFFASPFVSLGHAQPADTDSIELTGFQTPTAAGNETGIWVWDETGLFWHITSRGTFKYELPNRGDIINQTPTDGEYPSFVERRGVVDSAGTLWVPMAVPNKLVKVTADGEFDFFSIGSVVGTSGSESIDVSIDPYLIVLTPDNAIWFPTANDDEGYDYNLRLTRFDLPQATSSAFHLPRLGSEFPANKTPTIFGLIAMSDGSVIFQQGGSTIYRMSPNGQTETYYSGVKGSLMAALDGAGNMWIQTEKDTKCWYRVSTTFRNKKFCFFLPGDEPAAVGAFSSFDGNVSFFDGEIFETTASPTGRFVAEFLGDMLASTRFLGKGPSTFHLKNFGQAFGEDNKLWFILRGRAKRDPTASDPTFLMRSRDHRDKLQPFNVRYSVTSDVLRSGYLSFILTARNAPTSETITVGLVSSRDKQFDANDRFIKTTRIPVDRRSKSLNAVARVRFNFRLPRTYGPYLYICIDCDPTLPFEFNKGKTRAVVLKRNRARR